MKGEQLLLGIDGGGTKTVAWLVQREPGPSVSLLGKGVSGSSNLRSAGVDVALKNLDDALNQAFRAAGSQPRRVAAACLGLAGADRDADRCTIEDWADQRGLAQVTTCVHDAMTVLFAGFDSGVGVALVCGTGCLAFGRNATGETARSGGWGHLFGDEGSGYAIAVAGLRAISQMADGRGPPTKLLPIFLEELGLTDPSQLIAAIYNPQVDKSMIGGYAKLVFEAADRGDQIARKIVVDAADNLATMVTAVASRLRLGSPSLHLAISGGVVLHRTDFGELIRQRLAAAGVPVDPLVTVAEPVVGAVRLAARSLVTPAGDDDRRVGGHDTP